MVEPWAIWIMMPRDFLRQATLFLNSSAQSVLYKLHYQVEEILFVPKT